MAKANRLVLPLFLLLMWSLNSWALPMETQTAKDEGMRLWGISEWIEMQPYLEQSASAGDVESMYYLGEATRLLSRGLTTESMEWYLQAAEHGDPYAMLRLFQGGACTAGDRCPEGSDDWHEAALEITLPKAEAGDPEAMLAMYYIYANVDDSWLTSINNLVGIPTRAGKWLKRAAEAGLPEAQTLWGNQIMDGRQGWYFTSSGRLQAAEIWLKKASEKGHVPAMNILSEVLADQKEYGAAWDWLVKSSNGGHINGRLGEGWCYLNPADMDDERCQTEQNVIRGWAILYSILEETNEQSAQSIMNWNAEELTSDQKEEAEALAEAEWIGRQPPISKFPRRFGF